MVFGSIEPRVQIEESYVFPGSYCVLWPVCLFWNHACTSSCLAVNGGGCSGFQYEFSLVPGPEADDLIIERDGATLAVDVAALDLISGSEVDFIDSLIGASFQVQNPNAKSGCGCGASFSV